MGMLHGCGKIHGREQEEDKGLNQTHKDTQGHDGQGGKKGAGQHKQNGKNQLVAGHVSKETDAERQEARSMTDQFNRQYDGGHPPYGSHEVFVVLGTVEHETNDMCHDHDHNGAGQGGVDGCSWR